MEKNEEPKRTAAVLFYNNIPYAFSECSFFQIGASFVALYERADNACVLCRILEDSEESEYKGEKQKLITFEPLNSPTKRYVAIVKRDLHNLAEVAAVMKKYATVKNACKNMRVFEY